MFGCGIPYLARSSICREPVTVHRTATAIKQRERSTAVVMADSEAEAAALVQKTVVGPTARQMRAAVAVVEALGSVLVCPPALALRHQLQVLAHRREPHRRLAPLRWGNESQVGPGPRIMLKDVPQNELHAAGVTVEHLVPFREVRITGD